MKRYLTVYQHNPEEIKVFTEDNYPKTIPDNAEDWVWQYAPDAEIAKKQHDKKIDAWNQNPNKDTY